MRLLASSAAALFHHAEARKAAVEETSRSPLDMLSDTMQQMQDEFGRLQEEEPLLLSLLCGALAFLLLVWVASFFGYGLNISTSNNKAISRERHQRWTALLRRRPPTKHSEAMSAWLMEVLAVSDVDTPLKPLAPMPKKVSTRKPLLKKSQSLADRKLQVYEKRISRSNIDPSAEVDA